MRTKAKIRCFLSVLLALAMICNLNIMAGMTKVNAAAGYDIILTKVGAYAKDGKAIFYAKYCNVGNEAVSGNFKMCFYLDGKKVGEGEATSDGLQNGDGAGIVEASSPSESFSGTHEITAVADVDDAVTSDNNRTSYRKMESTAPTTQESTTQESTTQESTTQESTTPESTTPAPTSASQPQNYTVEVAALGGYPENIYEGDNITITMLVKNTCSYEIPAGTEFAIDFSIDGSAQKQVTMKQAIPVGGYVKIEVPWTATLGGHTFNARVENGNSITKKLNVEKKIKTNYTEREGVDLFVTDIGYYNVTTGEKNGSIKEGDLIQFIAYGVNAGTQKTPEETKHGVQFQIDGSTWDKGGTTWSDTFMGPLQPKETYEFQANGGNRDGEKGSCWKAENGSHTVLAWINDDPTEGNGITNEYTGNNRDTLITIHIPVQGTKFFEENEVNPPDDVNFTAAPLEVELGEITGLTTTSVKTTGVGLAWQPAEGASSYKIYRDGKLIDETITTTYFDNTTLEADKTYTYKVTAVQQIPTVKESTGQTVEATPITITSKVKAYPVPKQAKASDKHPDTSGTAFEKSPGITITANGEDVGVFKTRVYEDDERKGTYAYNNPDTSTNVAMFDYAGDVEVKIRVNRTDINSVSVKPKTKNINATCNALNGYTDITIQLSEGQQGQYSIEFNNNFKGNDTILLFAQEILEKPEDVWMSIDESAKIDDLVVPEGKTLWIEGGAALNGWVHLESGSQLMGRGIISQNNWDAWGGNNRRNPLSVGYEPVSYDGDRPYNNGTKAEDLGSENVRIIGISVFDSTGWAINIRNSNNVLLKDVNVITARSNGDGITVQSSWDVTIDGCFVRSSDDSIVVKNYDKYNSYNVKVQNCTIWTDIAQSLEIGVETNMGGASDSRCEAGETNTDPEIHDIYFKDIYVIHNFHKTVLSIHNGDNVPIYNIVYKNIYIDDKRKGGDGCAHSIEAFADGSNKDWTHNWGDNGYIKDVWYYNIIGSTGKGRMDIENVHDEDPANQFPGL